MNVYKYLRYTPSSAFQYKQWFKDRGHFFSEVQNLLSSNVYMLFRLQVYMGCCPFKVWDSSKVTSWWDHLQDWTGKCLCTNWAASWQNQQHDCAPSEDSDQPGHPPSLIRVLAVRMKKLGSLATHWAHSKDSDQSERMHRLIWVFAGRICQFAGFVMRRLNCFFKYLCQRKPLF